MRSFLLALGVLPVSAFAQDYWFPLHAVDLQPGERYATFTHAEGIQTRGRDIHLRRYEGGGRWTAWTRPQDLPAGAPPLPSTIGDPVENVHSLIYGHPFYAIADGEVVGCWRLAPDNPRAGELDPDFEPPGDQRIIGGGNHLWIRQDDGVVVLYAHAIPDTIPEEICPGKPLRLTPGPVQPGLPGQPDVAPDAYVPDGVAPAIATGTTVLGVEVVRPRVVAGQFLGLVGNSGSSGGPHLHIHGEVIDRAFRSLGPAHLTYDAGLFAQWRQDQTDLDFWTTFRDNTLPKGSILIWPPARIDVEYTRHGLPLEEWPRFRQWLEDSNLIPVALDCYRVGQSTFVNMSWEPDAGREWQAELGIDAGRFQAEMTRLDAPDDLGRDWRPALVESCRGPGNDILYGYVAVLNPGGVVWSVRHGLSPGAHQDHFDAMVGLALNPVALSVVSIGNVRSFTSLYDDRPIGAWQEHPRLTVFGNSDQYQDAFETATAAGLEPIHLNAYRHNNRDTLVAIFAEGSATSVIGGHGMTADQTQSTFESALGQGFRTRTLTGMDGAAQDHGFAGAWLQ